MAKPIEIPFAYGDVIAITGTGSKVVLWLKEPTGLVRGLLVDVTNPAAPVLSKDEILIRRRTEGQVRKKKLPPVGSASVTDFNKPV